MSNPRAFTARYLDVPKGLLGWDASADDHGDLMFALSQALLADFAR